MSTRASTSNAQRSQSAKVHGYVNRQLDKTRRQVKSTELITHFLVVTIFVVGFLQLMALVDAWVWSFNSVARWLALIFLVGAVVGYLCLTVFPLLLRKIHPDYAARMIEEFQPTFKNSLLNYVSLRRQPESTHTAVMDAVTKQAAIDLQAVPEDATVDRSSIVRIGFYLLGLIAFAAAYWMLSPKDPLQSFSRILLPSAKKSAPSIVQVTDVSPGDQEIFFGDPVVVSATIKGQFSPEDVQLVYSTIDGQVIDQVVPMQPHTTSSNRYETTLTTGQGGVQQGLVYKVIARDGASPDYELVVRPNPSITLKTADITPPAYTLLPEETISGQGTIEVVEGSLIKVNAVANLPIKLAYIELLVKHPKNDAEYVVVESVSMVANQMEAHGEFHAIYNYQAQKQRATHFRLKFLSTEDDANQNANVHPMRIIADLAPQIEVLNPIQNSVRLPINETLLIDVRATDTDYGISSIELEMQNNGTSLFRKKKLPLQSEDGKKRVRGQFQFTPSKHFLRVGETVLFTATASDNRTSYLSGSLDPNQTMTRQYQIEVIDAVENPKRSPESDPDKGEENSEEKDPSEEGQQNASDNGESGGSSESGSSSEDGDASDQSNQSESGDEGESGAAGESGDEGGDSTGEGGTESQNQQSGTNNGGGDSATESGSENGGQDSGDSGGESAMTEGAGTEDTGTGNTGTGNTGSEGGGESSAQQESTGEGSNQREPSSNGSQEDGSQGNNTQGTESQSPTPNGGEQGASNQGAGSEGDSQGNNGQRSQQDGGQSDNQGDNGARKPLADDAADGDVMSRMEEIMNQEKSEQGDSAGQKTGSQDQQPAQQNTGSGTDPNQENPRQSEGTGSMQQGDNQPPQDAQGGDNNAQRGDGKSSSSLGEKNGNAKGSSGNQTGDQSQEGASSDNSNTGQSAETGGNDPGNAASENQQQPGESGSGESGSSGQSSQEGAKPSEKSGEGSSGQQKSGGDKSGEQGGGEQGGGEQGGGEQGGGEQGGGEQGGGEASGGQGGQPGGEGNTGEGQSGGPQQSSESQSSSSSGKSGGGAGNGPGGETIAEKENIEHSKKATDMVLKRLEQERFDPDPDLLEELNWSKEDLNQFLDRWQRMKAAAETGDPVAQQRYSKALKSLGLYSDDRQKKVSGIKDNQEGFNTDSAVNRPPQEIAPGYRAFKRARNRSKTK